MSHTAFSEDGHNCRFWSHMLFCSVTLPLLHQEEEFISLNLWIWAGIQTALTTEYCGNGAVLVKGVAFKWPGSFHLLSLILPLLFHIISYHVVRTENQPQLISQPTASVNYHHLNKPPQTSSSVEPLVDPDLAASWLQPQRSQAKTAQLSTHRKPWEINCFNPLNSGWFVILL